MSEAIEFIQDEVYRMLVRLGVEDGRAGDEAMQLCDRIRQGLGGDRYYIPTPGQDRRARNAAIREELAAGKTTREVARRHGVHPSTVSRAARADQEDEGFGGPDWTL